MPLGIQFMCTHVLHLEQPPKCLITTAAQDLLWYYRQQRARSADLPPPISHPPPTVNGILPFSISGPLLTSPSPHAGPAASASAKAAAAAAASSNVLYPSYRYNAKNFWLEYSTPPSTQFPDYDEDYYQVT